MSRESLTTILTATRERVDRLRPRLAQLRHAARDVPPPPSWTDAFGAPDVSLIAEIKRRSPSAGPIAPSIDPATHAHAYARGGARAISVLTDTLHFGGTLDDLIAVRGATPLPVLRKDFILDPVQLYESCVAGASAVLLIVRALSDDQLQELAGMSAELGLARLVEVHDHEELRRAVAVSPDAIGVNSRDLETFAVHLDGVETTLRQVPEHIPAVVESGITNRADVERVAGWGADAILVGTVLAGAVDPARAARDFCGVPRIARNTPRPKDTAGGQV